MGHAIMSCQNIGDLETAQSWIEKMGSSLERLLLWT